MIKIKTESIRNRLFAALVVTVALHASFLIFAPRNDSYPSATPPLYRAYMITSDSLAKTNYLSAAVNINASSYIVKPDIQSGFSSFAYQSKNRFQLKQEENSTLENYIETQNSSYYLKETLKRVNDRKILSAMAFIPQLSEIIPTNLNNSKIDYPVVFDCNGKIYRDLSAKLKTLDRTKAQNPTELNFEIRDSNKIPSASISRSSGDPILDDATAKLILPLIVHQMIRSGKNKILLTVNWK